MSITIPPLYTESGQENRNVAAKLMFACLGDKETHQHILHEYFATSFPVNSTPFNVIAAGARG